MESVAIVILPNESDNWNIDPPFQNDPIGSANGYIIANTPFTDVGFSDYYLLDSRLVDVGNTYNSIDFMQSTYSEREERNISYGIGGSAKLKDFTFSLADRDDLDVAQVSPSTGIYGREIELRIYYANSLSNDSEENYIVLFRGTVVSTTKQNGFKIDIKARGVTANNNPRIRGIPYIDVDGNIQYTFIFLGESTNSSFVKLDKRRGPGGIQLSFDASKYALKGIKIKDKELDEFYPVTSSYTIEADGGITFEGTAKATLRYDVLPADTDIIVNDGIDMLVLITGDVYAAHLIYRRKYTPTDTFTMTRMRTFVDDSDGRTYGIYRISPHVLYEEFWNYIFTYLPGESPILDAHGNDLGSYYIFQTDNYPRYDVNDFLGDSLEALSVFTEEAIKIPRLTTGLFTDKFLMSEREFRRRYYASMLPIEKKRQVIIKIDNEEMLVTYANDKYDGNTLRLLNVVRGINDTEITAHSSGAQVVVLSSDESQKPLILVYDNLKNILFSDSIIDRNNNYNVWNARFKTESLEDDNIPYVWKFFKEPRQLREYLFLDLRLPDISGELVNSYIISSMSHSIATGRPLPFHLGITLQVTEHPDTSSKSTDDFSRTFYSRSVFGYNKTNMLRVTKFKTAYDLHNYNNTQFVVPGDWEPSLSIPYLYFARTREIPGPVIQTTSFSEAEHILKGSWSVVNLGNVTQEIYKSYDVDNIDNDFNIRTYDDLKDLNLALVANPLLYTLQQAEIEILIKKLTLFAELRAPIADNDWYGIVKNLTNGDDQGTDIIDTFNLGANGSIYLTEDNKYLFAESDDIPFIVFEFSLTGTLTEIERVELPDYADVAPGYLGRISGRRIGKINNTLLTDYKWIETVDETDPTFPAFNTTIKSASSIRAVLVGSTVEDAGHFIISLISGVITVYKKEETGDRNPVSVLRRLLVEYAGYPNELIDDAENPLDTTTSFGRVRVSRAAMNHSCTAIIEKETNLNSIIDKLCKNFGFVLYENDAGKVALADLYPPREDTVTTTLDDSAIITDSKGIPSIEESHIDMRYMITKMDLRYAPFSDRFQEEILSDDLPSLHREDMEIASTFTNFESEVAFHHEFTYDRKTALDCALIKILFHFRPTRIFTIKTIISFAQKDLCTWLLIDSVHIKNTTGKIYLLISKKTITPINGKKSYAEIILFEYDWDKSFSQIQEVPHEILNTNYIEVITDTEQIQEVDDATGE